MKSGHYIYQKPCDWMGGVYNVRVIHDVSIMKDYLLKLK